MGFVCSVIMAVTLKPSANYQPDLCADNVYYSPRGGTVSLEPGATEPYEFVVQNDGAKTDTILLKGAIFAADEPGGPAPAAAAVVDNIELRWFKGTNDVTDKVMAGKFKLRNMASGAIGPVPPLRAELTAQSDATGDDDAVAVLIARSKHKPTRQDITSVQVRVSDPPAE